MDDEVRADDEGWLRVDPEEVRLPEHPEPEEVLRPAEQRPEAPHGTYTAHLRCGNCGHRNDVTLPRGESVSDTPCENCGVAGRLTPVG